MRRSAARWELLIRESSGARAVVTLTLGLLLGSCAGTDRDLGTILDAARVEAEAPGAILAVKTADGSSTVASSGYLDLDRSRPMGPQQPFYLGSVTKTYTAAAALRLAETGVLSLDDPIERWLPAFPRADEISLRQLLQHTSGLRDFYSYLYYRPDRGEMIELVTKEWTERELLEFAGRFGHSFEPGTDWAYSNTNYYLVGVIIERATGLTLSEAYRTLLFSPLGLTRTWLSWHEPPLGALPVGHMGPVEAWQHSEMFGTLGPTTALDRSPVEWGAGGLASSVSDAVDFLEALVSGRVLSDSTFSEMTDFVPTQPIGLPGSEGGAVESASGYGLGLVRMVRDGVEFIGHGGLFTGHTAGLWHVPECELTIGLYFNRGFIGQRDLLDEVAGAWCDASDETRR